MILFFHLRRQVSASSTLGKTQKEHLRRLKRVIGYMILYPIAYIILSLPLAAGRMAVARGDTLGIPYFCVAGAFISSSGFVDVIMYSLTRRALLSDSESSHPERCYLSGKLQNSHTTTITAENRFFRREMNKLHKRSSTNDNTGNECDCSTENIVQDANIGKVYQETTIEIVSEPAEHDALPSSDSANEPQSVEDSSHARGRWTINPDRGNTQRLQVCYDEELLFVSFIHVRMDTLIPIPAFLWFFTLLPSPWFSNSIFLCHSFSWFWS